MAAPVRQAPPQHVIVWRQEQGFAGWPANHGIWSWGNEIVVGFTTGHLKIGIPGHPLDPDRPHRQTQARSTDGGQTWMIEPFEPHPLGPQGLGTEGMNVAHPDFMWQIRGQEYCFSYDRGRTWHGPVDLPPLGTTRLDCRTDYLIDGPRELTAFLTAYKGNGSEGRPLTARTTDGGLSWRVLSAIGPEPVGYAIMPEAVRLSPRRLLCAVRQQDPGRAFIPIYVSDDNGASWTFLTSAAEIPGGTSNPPSLVLLADGRLALAYGYRFEPYGLRARISADQGRTWGREIVLRRDAGGWDIGYPRSVQRPDGKIVTVYYYNDTPDGERYIAATIWDPDNSPPALSPAGHDRLSLAPGTDRLRLEVRTDVPASVRYATKPGVPFERMTGMFQTANGTTHTADVTGLGDGKTYEYYVRATAEDGDQGWDELRLRVAVGDPARPPVQVALSAADAELTAPMALAIAKQVPDQGHLSSRRENRGQARFHFTIPRDGQYVIWAWVYGPSTAEDSFIVSVDDGPADIFDIAENKWSGRWHWCAVNGRDGRFPLALDPRTFTLSAGEHTLVVVAREPNACLGRLIVTDDLYFVPADGPVDLPRR